MDKDTTWYGSRPRPRPHWIRRGLSSPQRGTAAPPLFGPCLLWPRSPISATAELLLQNSQQCRWACWACSPPKKIAPSHGGSEPPFNIWFLRPTQILNPNDISIGSPGFAQLTQSVPILYNGPPFSPQNSNFPMGDLDPHLTHGSLSPTEYSTQTASRSVQPFLQC